MTPFSIDTSFAESSSIFSFEGICLLKREADVGQEWPVSMTVRNHLFPFRTQKLSSLVPKIVGWKRPVKIGRCRLLKKAASGPSLGPGPEIAYYAPLAQLVALVANTKAVSC